jgi:hypothetical protein
MHNVLFSENLSVVVGVVVVVVYRMVSQTQGEVAAVQILDRLSWNFRLNISCQKINCSGLQ